MSNTTQSYPLAPFTPHIDYAVCAVFEPCDACLLQNCFNCHAKLDKHYRVLAHVVKRDTTTCYTLPRRYDTRAQAETAKDLLTKEG